MITNILGSESGLCILPLFFISVDFTTAFAVMGVPTIIFYIMPGTIDDPLLQFNYQTRNNFLSQRSDKEGQHNIFLEPSPVKVHVVPTQVQLRKKLVLFVGHVFPGSPSFCSCWQWCAWNWLFPLFAEECGDSDHKHHLVEFLLIIEWGKSQPVFSVEGQLLQVKNL